MSMPTPDNGAQMPNVDPEVVAEMERAHLEDGKTVILCNLHGQHRIPLEDVNKLAEAFLALGDNADENVCPMALLTDERGNG
jgi:hypothetical protein